MSTNEYSIAFSEVLDVLQHSEIEVIEKIPIEIIKKIKEKSAKEYISKIDVDNFEVSEQAKGILAVIYQDYLCDDNEELEEFNRQLWKNEMEHQETLRKKYNPEDIFKNAKNPEKNSSISENMQMIEYKESILKKIMNKIKILFKRNNA